MNSSTFSFNYHASNEESQSSNINFHPTNLRGKAIGLWYAQRQLSGNSTRTSSKSHPTRSQPVATIELSPNEIQRVTEVHQLFDHEKETRKKFKKLSTNLQEDAIYDTSIDDVNHAMQFEKLHTSFQYFEPLDRKSEVDQYLLDDLRKKQCSSSYQTLKIQRTALPINKYRQQILDMIENNQLFILIGETGSGKTTQTAQFILDDQIFKNQGSLCRIVCSQPRRISATSVAQRVAQERGEINPGDSVGYHIRLSAQLPRKNGSILFCTTGMLLKYIEKFTSFEHFSHIILDEIHERNIDMDFLLIFIKRLLKLRPNIKVILMSASIQAEKFSSYFENCPILSIPGNMYSVREYFLEDYITKLKYPYDNRTNNQRSHRKLNNEEVDKNYDHYISELQFDLASQHKSIDVLKKIQAIGTDFNLEINCDLVVSVIEFICRISSQGTILVFLPGWSDITKCTQLLRQRSLLASYLHILPLHSLLPLCNQQEIFNPSPHPTLRKVILSTSIAETSITIDDVIYVIDTGRTKASDYDLETQGKCLLPTNVSRANLLQRKGRAGRTQPGECYRLFTRCNERLSFVDFPQAEMITSRLDNIYLQAKLLNISNIKLFLQDALDPPPIEAIEHAERFLSDIGALVSETNELTPIGKILAHLPMNPQIGKLLIMGYLFSCFDPILTIASILSYRDPFVTPIDKIQEINEIRRCFADKTMSDHLMLVNIYQEWKKQQNYRDKNHFCFEHFLNSNHMKMIDKVRNQLKHLIQDYFASYTDDANRNKNNYDLICALMCAGLYPNIARIRLSLDKSSKRPCLLETKYEKRILIHPRSVNSKLRDDDIRHSFVQSTLLVYHEKIRTSSIFIHDTSFISPYALLFFGKSQLSHETNPTNNDDNIILVDNWIKIKIDTKTNKLIDELKEKFNYLVEKKASKKNILLENEQHLIETIIHFIIKQDKNLVMQNNLIDDYSKKNMINEDWDDEIRNASNKNSSTFHES
ncbi:unnamed protein product [Rotaria magnacalcarata]|uniref:RNA helicase n=1 Tax=Rotaria magnacalcarata TaxID=392030 RepID=A0A816W7U0_9BILA|nr:unnamed protein product [Rotaria magnacalcarata]CAF4143956.1 unnamed protein product [Rotaria magnacalcarata]